MGARRRTRSPFLSTALIITCAVLLSACVRFQPVSLYDGVATSPPPERPRTLALAVEPEIYRDQNDDTIWFQDDARCTQGELVSDVVYEGQRAVAVTWDRATEG